MIIGLSGKVGTGKDTVANIIKDNYSNFKTVAFADKLKDITCKLLSIDRETIECYKREPIFISGFTIRTWLQRIGQLFRDEVNSEFWINKVINIQNDVIITDVRYLNEAEVIRKKGGILIRINRNINIDEHGTHPSEIELDDYNFDYIIDNNSSVKDLKLEVTNVLEHIFKDIEL